MKKLLCKIVIMAGIIVIICLGLNILLVQKWDYSTDNAASEIGKGFYEEPENSLDTLYLGVSSMRNAISPLVIWNEYGYTGYSRASSVQPTLGSYYLLEESLKTQSPKVVFLETGAMVDSFGGQINDYNTNEGKIHEVLDNMRFSTSKLNMVKELTERSDLSFAELMLPVYRYHDRWQSLTEQDFTDPFKEKYYPYKGNYPSLKRTDGKIDSNYMENSEGVVEELCEETVYYTRKMAELCEENGIKLVLVAMPTMSSSYSKHNLIQQFADMENLGFIDFNLPEIQEEINLNMNTDFVDYGSHLNIAGSRKISKYIGKYLNENFDFTDKRSDAAYERWNRDYALYSYEVEAYAISVTKNFYNYMELLHNPRYLTIISGKYDLSKYFSPDVYAEFQALGLQTNLVFYPYRSYAAVIDGSEVKYECVSEDVISETYMANECRVEFFSDTSRTNTGISSIVIDGKEYAKNTAGLNIVVYDKELKRVVSSTCYNTGKTGRLYKKK